MVFAHVIYKKTGAERKNVTVKAYNLLKNQYTLLGYVDENGNPVAGPEEAKVQVRTQKKSVEPAAAKEPFKKMTPEEIEAKKAELQEMNRVAIQKAIDEQAKRELTQTPFVVNDERPQVNLDTLPEVKQRKKPGPKPKNNA